MTELEGTVEFEDLVEGVSITEVTDEATGISQRVVADSRQARGADLKPAMVIKDGKVPLKSSQTAMKPAIFLRSARFCR